MMNNKVPRLAFFFEVVITCTNGTNQTRDDSMGTVTTSVIIPVYNDPEGLETTVDSLLDQTVEDYEIIIADNASTDCTQAIASAYSNLAEVTHVIEDEVQSSYAARNAGIIASQGEILCFVDADMWVDSTWLEQVQSRMNADDIDYFGCNVEIVIEDETPSAAYNQQNSFHSFSIENAVSERHFAPTCCLVTRKRVIEDVGLFDERLISGGDAEFGRRVHEAGYEQVYAADITMYHPARSSLPSIVKRRYRIARGQVQRARYHPELFQFEIEPLNPRNFLPIKPQVVYRSHEGTFKQFLIHYTISSADKMAAGFGQAREWLFPANQ